MNCNRFAQRSRNLRIKSWGRLVITLIQSADKNIVEVVVKMK